MNTSRFLVIIGFVLWTIHGNSQHWSELRFSGASFSEIQDAFYSNPNAPEEPGYKQFKRWEYFMEPRVLEDGSLPKGSQVFSAVKELNQYRAYSSNRDEGNWTSMGLESWSTSSYNPGNGRASAVAVDPNNSEVIFLGTPSGGLWKSEDDGDNWEPLTDQLPTLGISGIAIDPANSNVIYLATGDGDGGDNYSVGVLKSLDGGDTWNTTGLSYGVNEEIRCNRLLMHPDNSQTLLVASTDGIWKTTTGGEVWYKVQAGNMRDLEYHPSNPDIVYAVNTTLWKSIDGGEDFDPTSEGLPNTNQIGRISLAVTPADPSMVYLLLSSDQDQSFLGLYRSTDEGESFSLRSDSPNILTYAEDGDGSGGQAWYDLALAVSPTDPNHLFTGGINVWESNNGGQSLSINSHWYYQPGMSNNYTHADIHQLDFIGGHLYCLSDGGIFRSVNNGSSFQDLSSGLSISQFYRLGLDPQNEGRVIAGTQDNGSNLLENENWTHILGADGMEGIIHPENSNIIFASTQFGGINKSVDGGQDFDWSASGINEDGGWVTPYIFHPSNPSKMYAAFENVWQSDNGAGFWYPISNFTISGSLSYLDSEGGNSPHIYTGTGNHIFHSENGGDDWLEITSGLPNYSISSVEILPSNPQIAWVTLSGFGIGQKVYKTDNGGLNWTNISHNLPNVPANCIVVDEDADQSLYVGTDIGVFYTNNTLANWQPFSENLPRTIVSELEIHDSSGKIYAATYGRGIWSTDLHQGISDLPMVIINSDVRFICEGSSVLFDDASLENNPIWSWEFEGGDPATSDLRDPEVYYYSAGTYDVTLTVENEMGSQTLTFENFITVYPIPAVLDNIQEGFESYETISELDWNFDSDIEPNEWRINTDFGSTGEHSAWIRNFELDELHRYDLISPVINLSERDSGHVNFKLAYAQRHDDDDDRLRLYFSDDCGSSWTLKKQWRGKTNLPSAAIHFDEFFPEENEWDQESAEINASFLVESFMFKYEFINDNGNNIFIDDINIGDIGLNIPFSTRSLAVSVYPNPFRNSFNIDFPKSWKNVQLTLIDPLAKTVYEHTFASANPPMRIQPTAHLTKGAYILIATHDEGSVRMLIMNE